MSSHYPNVFLEHQFTHYIKVKSNQMNKSNNPLFLKKEKLNNANPDDVIWRKYVCFGFNKIK